MMVVNFSDLLLNVRNMPSVLWHS